MTPPPSKQLDQFVVRLPDGMRDRIKAAAEANNRSMNAEIVATLEEKYPSLSPIRDFLDAVNTAIAAIETINDPDKRLATWLDFRSTFIDRTRDLLNYAKTLPDDSDASDERIAALEEQLREMAENPPVRKGSAVHRITPTNP